MTGLEFETRHLYSGGWCPIITLCHLQLHGSFVVKVKWEDVCLLLRWWCSQSFKWFPIPLAMSVLLSVNLPWSLAIFQSHISPCTSKCTLIPKLKLLPTIFRFSNPRPTTYSPMSSYEICLLVALCEIAEPLHTAPRTLSPLSTKSGMSPRAFWPEVLRVTEALIIVAEMLLYIPSKVLRHLTFQSVGWPETNSILLCLLTRT